MHILGLYLFTNKDQVWFSFSFVPIIDKSRLISLIVGSMMDNVTNLSKNFTYQTLLSNLKLQSLTYRTQVCKSNLYNKTLFS